MKKEKRILIGLLCTVLLLTNTLSTEIQVLAVENVNESQNIVNIIDEADSASSDNDVENKDSQSGGLEDENDNEMTPEESESEKTEQEEAENKEAEADGANADTGDSEREEEQVIPDNMEETASDEKEADTKTASSLSAEERLKSMSSDDDIASGTDGDIAWVIDSDGKLTVEGSGDFTSSGNNYFGYSYPKWYDYKQLIISAEIKVEGMTNASAMFLNCEKLQSVDLSKFNTENVTDMRYMFSGCSSLQSLDLSNFNTSIVTNMNNMFSGCSSLQSLNLSNFNTSKVISMLAMFEGCSSLQSLNLSNFDTSKVTSMDYMFFECSSLQSLNLSNFDTSKVTGIHNMFSRCSSLQSLDLSNFDTSKVTNMDQLFYECRNLKSLNLSNFDDSSVASMHEMFGLCSSLESLDLSSFGTNEVVDMTYMFNGCSNMQSLDLSNFDTSKVTDMKYMFNGCSSLQSLNLSNFDTSKVRDMNFMFNGCSSLQSLDLSNFDTSRVTDMNKMFSECSSLQSLDLSSFDASKVVNAWNVFDNNYDYDLLTIYTPKNLRNNIDLPIKSEQWYLSDGSTVTSLPQNLSYSVEVGRGYIPREVEKPGEEEKPTGDKLKYVQNLTQVSLKNADVESKKSIDNAIYNLLFKAEYSPMGSKIPGDTMSFTGTKEVIAKWPIQNIHFETKAYWNRTVNDSQLGTIKFNNAAAGCMSYAYFASTYIYGTNGTSKKSKNLSADGVKEFIRQYADPGEHLRYQQPHSIVFLGESSDGDGFYYISYGGGVSSRGVSHNLYLAEYTSYENFASIVRKKGDTLYIYDTNKGSYYNRTARTVADVRSGNGTEKIVTRIACPVEAIIELNGEILDSRSLGTASFGTVERDNDEIVFNLEYSPDYNLTIIGTGEGSMSLTLEYYDNINELVDKRVFVNVPIVSSTEIQSSGFDSRSDFVLYVSDDTNEMETWGAGPGETAYDPDNIHRSDNDSEDDVSEDDGEKDNDESGILPGDLPSDGIIPDGIWSAGVIDTGYSSSNITQSFRLYDGNKRLQEKVDYTVSYKNNKNAYTYTDEDYAGFEEYLQITGEPTEYGTFDPKKAPQVIVKMKGNYSGSQAIYFRIQPADITDDDFSAANLAVTYSGKKQNPAPTVTWKGKALKYNTDFYIPEYDNVSYDKTAFSDSGAYDLTVVGKNNFTGEISITLTISESNKQIAMSSVTVKGVSNQVWTGQQIRPDGYTVKYKTDVLSEANGDYTVSFGENTAVGTGTITLTGTGTDNDRDGYSYIGTKIITFKIAGMAMNKVTVSGVEKSYKYTGTAIEPSATLTYKVNKNAVPVTLVNDTHYNVTYQKNQDKGTATIIFTGLESGGYTGTKKITFKITASGIGDKAENENQVEQFQITYKEAENIQDGIYVAPYMKGGVKPEVTVTSGSRTLKPGKDYTISYSNNKKIALSTDKKAPSITIKGKGNYSGSRKINFTIALKPLSEENGINVVAKDKVASTKKNGYRQSFKVYDADGKALGGSDYDSKNVIYTLIRTKDEDGTEIDVNEVLDQNSVVPANSVIRITVQGKGNYAGGSVSGTYRIIEADHDISRATIQINNQEYTGKPVMITDQSQFKPYKVYLKNGREMKVLTLGEDIEVVPDSYVKNINKGTAKVTFRGINDFGGTKTVSFKIGTRSISDFWRGIFSKIPGLMTYNEIDLAFPKYVARMT